MTLVDANVLLDLFTGDATWKDWSRGQLKAVLLDGGAAVNPIVYAEVSLAFAHEREPEVALRSLGITKLPLPYEAAFPARRAFWRYRRDGGQRRSPLPAAPREERPTATERWVRRSGSIAGSEA